MNSANFAITEFSEVDSEVRLVSSCLWWRGYPAVDIDLLKGRSPDQSSNDRKSYGRIVPDHVYHLDSPALFLYGPVVDDPRTSSPVLAPTTARPWVRSWSCSSSSRT